MDVKHVGLLFIIPAKELKEFEYYKKIDLQSIPYAKGSFNGLNTSIEK